MTFRLGQPRSRSACVAGRNTLNAAARAARARRPWRAALVGAVMLGLSVSPSWGQSGNYGVDTDYFAPATENCSGPADAGNNGIITGPGGTRPGTASFHLFDPIATQTCNGSINSANSWFAQIAFLMQYTFNVLAVLELCWAAALWAFEHENLTSLGAEMIKKIMFIGFFYTLLHYAQVWIPTITDTFSNIGTQVTHIPASTDSIVAQGLAEIDFIWKNATKMTIENVIKLIPPYAFALLLTVMIVISTLILAAQFFMAQVEGYIMLAVGAVFLGLGANRFTQEYVKKTLASAVVIGVRLLTIMLITALIQQVIEQSLQGWKFEMGPLGIIAAVTLMQLMMALQAPEMASALMKGGAGLSAGVVGKVAGALATNAISGVRNLTGGAAKAVGGAANMASNKAKGAAGGQGGKDQSNASVAGLGGGAASKGGTGGTARKG